MPSCFNAHDSPVPVVDLHSNNFSESFFPHGSLRGFNANVDISTLCDRYKYYIGSFMPVRVIAVSTLPILEFF
jgi:hypothetical protein